MKKSRLISKVCMLVMIMTVSIGLTGCGGNKATKEAVNTLDKETLIVGLDDTFAPMGFKDESGEIVGFDVDLAKAVGEKLGKKMEFQTIDWNMKETELNAGNIDFIWNGYSITDERKEQVAFGTPYLKNKQVIVTLADTPINSKADLQGKAIGAQTGSSAVDAMNEETEVVEGFKDGKPVTYKSNNDVLMDLEAGRIDAAVADEVIVKYYISKKGAEKYKILDESFGEEEYGVGMRKEDTALIEAFNKSYDELKQEGKLKAISEQWFGEDITQ